LGLPLVVIEKKHRYDYLSYLKIPETKQEKIALNIRMMKNEVRSDALLLTATGEQEVIGSLTIQGQNLSGVLEGIQLQSTLWVDTAERKPVSDALIILEQRAGKYALPLFPGLTRKLWLTVDSKKVKPGRYQGEIVLEGGKQISKIAFDIQVSTLSMDRPRLHLGN
jgi:hypothetical protein